MSIDNNTTLMAPRDNDPVVQAIRAAFPTHKIEFNKVCNPNTLTPLIHIYVDGHELSVKWNQEMHTELYAYHGISAEKEIADMLIAAIKQHLSK